MRSARTFETAYRRHVPGASTGKIHADVALVDLCLHFLAVHCPGNSTEAIPYLLLGYPRIHSEQPPDVALVNLRHLAKKFSSPIAWAAALDRHARAPIQQGYKLLNGVPQPHSVLTPTVQTLLNTALQSAPPRGTSNLRFAAPGDARVATPSGGFLTFQVPDSPAGNEPRNDQASVRTSFESRRRNPPITVTWDDLVACAKEVDAREASAHWPRWLSPLSLERRLSAVSIRPFNRAFFDGDRLTLDGLHHVVGMLSSGKSTLLMSLLFLLGGKNYSKRVLVVTQDTASATELVARLKAHEIAATLISSFRNREHHLAAVHWNASTLDADQVLHASAHKAEPLGLACPLEGMQVLDEDAFRSADEAPRLSLRLRDRPCHSLLQMPSSPTAARPASSPSARPESHWQKRDCPLLPSCPTHSQENQLTTTGVFVMTSQALLQMQPPVHVVTDRISYPELFQHLADVVLIDEVDAIQRQFDETFCVRETLLSTEDHTYAFATNRAVMSALQRGGGVQYSEPRNVQWHARLNHLQTSIGLLYRLLLNHEDDVKWLTGGQTFTAASILCDLWRLRDAQAPDAPSDDVALHADFQAIIAALGRLSGELVADVVEPDSSLADATTPQLREAFRVLGQLQQRMLAHGEVPLDEVLHAVNEGDLQCFAISGQAPRRRRQKRTPINNQAVALALSLAVLSNACLGLFSHLVRNQAAVEEDFELTDIDVFRRLRRLNAMYDSLVPASPSGTAYGLMFESDSTGGAALRLVNHIGVGRYLLVNFHRLLRAEGQAGPHVVMLSGTSWAGGPDRHPDMTIETTSSPRFDVQVPVAAILEQPIQEREAIKQCVFELSPVTNKPLQVSGLLPAERNDNLRLIAACLTRHGAAGSMLDTQWSANSVLWGQEAVADRRRALIVVNSYADARVCANAAAKASAGHHVVYLMVPDDTTQLLRGNERRPIGDEPLSPAVRLLPRSRVEQFGKTPEGAVLIAPIQPVSRGHNILNARGVAAISAIYFTHRPHPRPDDLEPVIGQVNRLALDLLSGSAVIPDAKRSIVDRGRWLRWMGRAMIDQALASRVAYSTMPDASQQQFAWDLITLLWQTIGRGIRSGSPVYVRFVDSRFSPGAFEGVEEGPTTSCLRRCVTTLRAAMANATSGEVATALYGPFLDALDSMYARIGTQGKDNVDAAA